MTIRNDAVTLSMTPSQTVLAIESLSIGIATMRFHHGVRDQPASDALRAMRSELDAQLGLPEWMVRELCDRRSPIWSILVDLEAGGDQPVAVGTTLDEKGYTPRLGIWIERAGRRSTVLVLKATDADRKAAEGRPWAERTVGRRLLDRFDGCVEAMIDLLRRSASPEVEFMVDAPMTIDLPAHVASLGFRDREVIEQAIASALSDGLSHRHDACGPTSTHGPRIRSGDDGVIVEFRAVVPIELRSSPDIVDLTGILQDRSPSPRP